MIIKKIFRHLLVASSLCLVFSCADSSGDDSATQTDAAAPTGEVGQLNVQDDVSQKNVVQVASTSKDHTTLVAAVKQAQLVNALSNAGPFTVFAPTNAAFDKLPSGTVDNLMKDAQREQLQDILQYHVSLGVFKPENFQDGQSIGQANGGNIKISVKDGKVMVNETATIVTSIPASNGIIHVIDGVLLPPSNK